MRIYTDGTERNKKFEKLCLKTQDEMKKYVEARLRSMKGNVVVEDGFVFREGKFPVLLCAHMDTVHDEVPQTFVYVNGTLTSPQGIGGDDRCGIYMIFKILKKYDCSVVFLENEEIGCVGARKFAKSKVVDSLYLRENGDRIKFIMEFDRKNANDAVFYDCANDDFDKWIESTGYFKKGYGTCSDISYIAPELDCAAVNLSCGYYHEHHIDHHVVLAEMERSADEAMKLLEASKGVDWFEYVECSYYEKHYREYGYRGYNYGYGYGNYSYTSSTKSETPSDDKEGETYYVTFSEKGVQKTATIYDATSEASAYYKFAKRYASVAYEDVDFFGTLDEYYDSFDGLFK